MASQLPPFARRYLAVRPDPGAVVITGPGAWKYARPWASTRQPRMVLPADAHPRDFSWPRTYREALVYELGQGDDGRLTELARELLAAGARCVVALRYLGHSRPRRTVFFYGRPDDGA